LTLTHKRTHRPPACITHPRLSAGSVAANCTDADSGAVLRTETETDREKEKEREKERERDMEMGIEIDWKMETQTV